MRRYFVLIGMVLCICFLGGCAAEEKTLTEGTYFLNNTGESFTAILDLKQEEEGYSFVFLYDPLSSYMNYGNAAVDGDTVICTTSDGKYEYTFEIKDETTIEFNGKKSATVKSVEGEIIVEDGAEFLLSQE